MWGITTISVLALTVRLVKLNDAILPPSSSSMAFSRWTALPKMLKPKELGAYPPGSTPHPALSRWHCFLGQTFPQKGEKAIWLPQLVLLSLAEGSSQSTAGHDVTNWGLCLCLEEAGGMEEKVLWEGGGACDIERMWEPYNVLWIAQFKGKICWGFVSDWNAWLHRRRSEREISTGQPCFLVELFRPQVSWNADAQGKTNSN